MDRIDLRSDTVTQPTPAMREAMAKAVVGDDVYGEDPTVNRLQALAATLMGKEAGLFVPSGTMGNLVAVLTHCGRGDEAILGDQAHTYLSEAGGISALGGVQVHPLPNQPDGTLRLGEIALAIRADDPHYPTSRLLLLENTHNRCGGIPLPISYVEEACQLAKARGLGTHLDGARIFNAAVALNHPAKALAAPFDSVTFCLSKGLCAPVGSVLCGSMAFIEKALRIRKQVGGGMRQAGIIAAAGLVALEDMIDRLAEDHRHADKLAAGLRRIPGLAVDAGLPVTNMIYLSISEEVGIGAADLAARLMDHGILVDVIGTHRLRLVLHYWVRADDLNPVVARFTEILAQG